MNIIEQLTPALLQIAGILLSALAGWLGLKVKAWLNTQEKRAIVESTVKYVEQVGRALGSEQKFELAKATALAWFSEKGLKIGETELSVLIEAAVNDFFEHYELEHGQKSGGQNEPVEAQVE